ncbi:DinB/UmuC family translesion DNA polymerase [Streptomyces werraensis]|uniref:DinB/UmuC family translesion DNA polymerase n=1 Tax=Streptomyces werraensis TaxID=68284 RepID=UPI0033B4C924
MRLSPVVQALQPTVALVELKGALRYHGLETHRLGEVLRVRTLSRLGVDVRVGLRPSITIAATASAQVPLPGGALTVAPDDMTDWLAPLLVEALHGIGPRQAGALHAYGIHTVGLLAAVSPETVQRLLGREGRTARRRPGPRPRPPAPSYPRALPAAATVSLRFDRHVLDGADVRAALLDLVVQLGRLLRRRDQVARAVSLTLQFASGGSWEKTRRLPEPSAHDEDLRTTASRLIDAAGLQRGRLTGLVIKGDDLVDADRVAQQISLDQAREPGSSPKPPSTGAATS